MALEFEKCARRLGPDGLSLVIGGVLNRNEIAKILERCGIVYPGVRISSISPIILARDLAQESLLNPEVAKELKKSFTKRCEREASFVSGLSLAKIKQLVKEPRQIMGQMKPEVFLWLLASDERPEVNTLVPKFRKSVERFFKQALETSEELDFALLAAKDKELQLAQNRQKQLEEQLCSLEAKLRAKEKTSLEYQKQIAELKALEREVRRRNEELDGELRSLRKKIEEVPQWEGKAHALERENKKLEYELQRLKEGSKTQGFPLTKLDSLENELVRLRQEIQEIPQKVSGQNVWLSKMLEGILKETALVKSELMKLTKSREILPKRLGGTSERVGVFVDVQNLYYAARDRYSARIDYAKLLDYVVRERRLVKALAYVVKSSDFDQTTFFSMLERYSYEPRIKELRVRQDGSAKGNWDMGMAVEIIGMADKLDVVALVSGDGDFVPLVNLIKNKGPLVEVYGFSFNTAIDLKETADNYFPLGEDILLR